MPICAGFSDAAGRKKQPLSAQARPRPLTLTPTQMDPELNPGFKKQPLSAWARPRQTPSALTLSPKP